MKLILSILFSFLSTLTFGQISVTNTLQVNTARGAAPLQVIPSSGGLGYFDINGMLKKTDIISATTGMSFNNITAIGAVRGIAGGTVFVKGFNKSGDGGGGLFYWDDTATSGAQTGLILQVSGVAVGRWKRTGGEIVDIRQVGGVGDGTTDNTVAFNYAATLGRRIYLPIGTYLLNGRVNVNNSGSSFIGENKGLVKIVGTTAQTFFFLFGASNVRFENISFINNYPTEVSASTCCIKTITDSTFDGVNYTPIDSGLYINNCYFTCPKGDGILIVSNRGTPTRGLKKDIYITNNTFENIGSTGMTCLAGSTEGMYNVHFEHNITRHTGLMDDAPGMAVSFSGDGIHNAYVIDNQAHDYKTIGYEFAGISYSLMQDNTGDSSHRNQTSPGFIATCLFTMDATGSPSAVGNKAIHNTSLDNTPSFPHLNNQNRVTLQDNTLISDSIVLLFDSVRNIDISGDRYTRMTTNTRPILYMRNGSANAYINGAHFIGNSSQNQLILFQNRTLHVRMENCHASGNAVDGTLVNADTSCHDITGTFNSVLRGSFNFEYGLPVAGSPQYDIVIDNDGIRKKYPHGGTWTISGNMVYPAFPFVDSVVIGGIVGVSPFTLYGKESQFFVNTNPALGLAQIATSMTIQQNATGGTGITLTGSQVNWRVTSGDTIGNALGYNVTFDNSFNILGRINNGVGFSFAPGMTATDIGSLTGIVLADGSSSSTYTGIFSGITASGSNKYFIFHNGTAPSYFNGPLGVGALASSNAAFDVQSTTKGSLPFPRMTNTQRDALTNSEGDCIYSLTDHTIEFYNGSTWKQITTN